MKKIISIALVAALAMSLCACGSSSKAKYTVGVCQFVQHVALDDATQGFIDALKAELGDDVEIINENASGEVTNCSTIVNGFVSSKVDLILANATPALTAAVSATSDIPVLGTAITAYSVALYNGPVKPHKVF